MKKKRYMAAALLCSAVLFSGCGAGGNENISAGMEQVEALERSEERRGGKEC